MMEKINLKNYTLEELENLMEQFDEKKFRARQIFSWLYKGVYDFEEMTNLSKSLRNQLKEYCYIENISDKQIMISKEDSTRKYLFGLKDDHIIESVYMEYKHGSTVCISSQVGCGMGCSFCASAIGGVKRNLHASEMLEQVLQIQNDVSKRISNVVIMGSGEPFENFEEVLKFLKIINNDQGLNIGLRNITISTCGILPKIIEFAKQMPQVTLAISLHAPNNNIRNKIMSINKKYPIEELMKVCQQYISLTNKRITFEYALIEGLNDSKENAEQLAGLLKNMLCHVNLIPLNNVEEMQYKGSTRAAAMHFKDVLEKNGINATIRRELGEDIDAACGQLRRRHIKN
ncbi:MAG: 23S rRNA (adenine(2503)-C(2))-methyltransferase RlmN [Clostridia bacterium]|nr:23S rRNA (adenine(2503)-C(2))-methyltransferase RlmN [Clostridia bacterium]